MFFSLFLFLLKQQSYHLKQAENGGNEFQKFPNQRKTFDFEIFALHCFLLTPPSRFIILIIFFLNYRFYETKVKTCFFIYLKKSTTKKGTIISIMPLIFVVYFYISILHLNYFFPLFERVFHTLNNTLVQKPKKHRT